MVVDGGGKRLVVDQATRRSSISIVANKADGSDVVKGKSKKMCSLLLLVAARLSSAGNSLIRGKIWNSTLAKINA